MNLPDNAFSELALDLYLVACDEARSLGALEGSSAQYRRAGIEAGLNAEDQERNWRQYEAALLTARRSAQAADAAHQMMKSLAPFEDSIRALVESARREQAA
jgi:hypothetical protein